MYLPSSGSCWCDVFNLVDYCCFMLGGRSISLSYYSLSVSSQCMVSELFFKNTNIVFHLGLICRHILVCLASYMACVCFAYFYAFHEAPEQCPRLRFWPHDRHTWFGIPYVSLMVASVKSFKSL